MLQSILVYGFMIVSMMFFASMITRLQSKTYYHKIAVFISYVIILFIFSFFSGVRFDVGVDHQQYHYSYKQVEYFQLVSSRTEWLFSALTLFFANNGIHATVYFGVLAFIQLFLVLMAFKEQKYILPFLLFALLTSGTYFMFMNAIRQMIVFSLFLYSIRFIEQKNIIAYIGFLFVSFFIHRSVLILAPIFFLRYDYFRRRFITLSLIIIALVLSYVDWWNNLINYIDQGIVLLGYDDYSEKLRYHIELRDNVFNRSIRFYFPLLNYILVVLYSNNLKGYFRHSFFIIVYNVFVLGAIFWLLSYNNPLIQRPFMYFIFTNFVGSAYLLTYLWRNKHMHKHNILLLFWVIISHVLIFYAYIVADFHTQYKFYWDYL